MIFIAGAFLASIINVLVALAFTLHLNVSNYFDISLMCGVLLQDDGVCRAGALNAGYAMLWGMLICLAFAISFGRRFVPPVGGAEIRRSAFGWILLAVVVLLGSHIVWDALSIKEVSRIKAITEGATFISIENVLWPLLLQLMNSSKRWKFKFLYFSLLLPIVSFSPYRGVLFAVLVFGIGLPVLAEIARQRKQRMNFLGQRRMIAGIALALLVGAPLLLTIYNDTRNRVSDMATPGTQADQQSKLTQRLAYPIFQAYFAEKIAKQEQVPTAWDEVLRKLRLAHGPNLNAYLYSKVYGDGTAGEMTSLYYGEAAANSVSSPIIWIVIGPMMLVALWVVLQRSGYEVGTLVGIAIWRGSLGGVATVLPALIIQILTVLIFSHRTKKSETR